MEVEEEGGSTASIRPPGGPATTGEAAHDGLDYSLPTTEELINLKETALLFKSNLFKLQIDELLREISPKGIAPPHQEPDRKLSEPLDNYLKEVKVCLEKGFSSKGKTVRMRPGESILGTVPVPYKKEFQFELHKPVRLTVVGSYLLRCIAKPLTNVDIAVEIPKESLLQKDYLNYRYLAKRAAYVEAMHQILKKDKTNKFTNVKIGYFMGDPLKPIVILTPKKGTTDGLPKKHARFKIRIYPCISPNQFPPHKLLPPRNCARQIHGGEEHKENDKKDGPVVTATPLYNQRVLEDMGFIVHLRLLHRTIHNLPALGQTVQLMKIWARQRGIYAQFEEDGSLSRSSGGRAGGLDGGGGWSGFGMGMLLVYLVEQRKVTRTMSVNQAFKAVIRFLATSNELHESACHITGANLSSGSFTPNSKLGAVLNTYPKAFSASLIGPLGVNVLSRVSPSSYRWLQSQAQRTLDLLGEGENESANDEEEQEDVADADEANDPNNVVTSSAQGLADQAAFKSIFLLPVSPFKGALDAYLTLSLKPRKEDRPGGGPKISISDPVLPSLNPKQALLRQIDRTLLRAFSDRITHLVSRYVGSNGGTEEEDATVKVQVGISLDNENAYKRIEMGPNADDKKNAADFRAFWGARSELRRFQDGRITEAVVWEDDDEDEGDDGVQSTVGASILTDIAKFVLNRHLKKFSAGAHLVLSQPESVSLVFRKPVTVMLQNPTNERIDDIALRGLDKRRRKKRLKKMFEDRLERERKSMMQLAPIASRDPLIASESLQRATDILGQRLRDLRQIPLTILAVMPASSALRFTNPFPPLPVALPQHFGSRVDFPDAMAILESNDAKYEAKNSSDVENADSKYEARKGAEVVNLVIRFESSNQWPDDVIAISRIKTAFYLQIHSALATMHGDISCSAGNDHLDVLFCGFCFRIKIFYDREMAHREAIANASVALALRRGDGVLKTTALRQPYLAFKRELVAKPTHHALVKGFHLKHPTYGRACRIAKRWAASHMFLSRAECSLGWCRAASAAPADESSDPQGPMVGPRASLSPLQRLPEEAIELIVAVAYARPGSLPAPASPLSGFLRFLDLMSTHHWEEEPLFADINLTMSTVVRSRALQRFAKRRGGASSGGVGGPALYIITAEDPNSEMWTSETPTRNLLKQICAYARASADHIRKLILKEPTGLTKKKTKKKKSGNADGLGEWKTIFATPIQSFDLFISVNEATLGRLFPNACIVKGKYSKRKKSTHELPLRKKQLRKRLRSIHENDPIGEDENPCLDRAMPGFDPLDMFVKDIQQSLGSMLDFCYDIYGAAGPIVLAKWKDGKYSPKKFSVATAPHTCPVSENKMSWDSEASNVDFVVPNKVQIIETIKTIGKGVVQEVYVGYSSFAASLK